MHNLLRAFNNAVPRLSRRVRGEPGARLFILEGADESIFRVPYPHISRMF